jgi:hypothetical protein
MSANVRSSLDSIANGRETAIISRSHFGLGDGGAPHRSRPFGGKFPIIAIEIAKPILEGLMANALARLFPWCARTWAARVSVVVFIALAGPATASTQSLEPLSGHVVDQTGTPLPGVSVQATSTDRKTSVTAVTDANGRYHFASLPAGQYGVTFQFLNFADVRRQAVAVSASAPATVDVTMQLALNAQVVVTAADTFRNLADLPHPEENLVGIANAASEGAVTARQIEARPIMRAGEVLETVPGVIISQHSGEGKANQYYLRGFNLDHGTDFATTVAGLPINLPTHAHGQGYSDLNFLIPELVTGVQFKKGPYDATEGDFSAAGSANINYANVLPHSIASVSAGQDGWSRLLLAASPRVGRGTVLAAIEVNHNDGPWVLPDDYKKINGVLRYSRGNTQNAFSLTGMAYASQWNSTDQVPDRAIADGQISRFGTIDDTDGGRTARYSVVADYQHTAAASLTRATAYASRYRLNLFSNFTYFLDDPEHGDQFEQADRRWIAGGRVTHTRRMHLGQRTGENVFGVQVRNDDIPVVGLYHTAARERLSVTRQDACIRRRSACSRRMNCAGYRGCARRGASAWMATALRWIPVMPRIPARRPARSSVRRAASSSAHGTRPRSISTPARDTTAMTRVAPRLPAIRQRASPPIPSRPWCERRAVKSVCVRSRFHASSRRSRYGVSISTRSCCSWGMPGRRKPAGPVRATASSGQTTCVCLRCSMSTPTSPGRTRGSRMRIRPAP